MKHLKKQGKIMYTKITRVAAALAKGGKEVSR